MPHRSLARSPRQGYKCIVITSPKCSKEKMDSIRAYGATLLVSGPGQNYMQMETDMCAENPAWFSVNQYNNLDNPEAHLHSTGPGKKPVFCVRAPPPLSPPTACAPDPPSAAVRCPRR